MIEQKIFQFEVRNNNAGDDVDEGDRKGADTSIKEDGSKSAAAAGSAAQSGAKSPPQLPHEQYYEGHSPEPPEKVRAIIIKIPYVSS